MKDIKSLMIGFLLSVCIFLLIGMSEKEINKNKKWIEEFPENGRYIPVMVKYRVLMMDSKTGSLYTSKWEKDDLNGKWILDTRLPK